MRVFIDILPSYLGYVVRESFELVSETCREMNDTIGYKTLHDAIISSESIRSCILKIVKPENLFFIFSQSIEAIYDVLTDSSLYYFPSKERNYLCCTINAKETDGRDKGYTEPCSIIICKLLETDACQKLFPTKKKKGRSNSYRYEITWRELDNLDYAFDVIGHNYSESNTWLCGSGG